MDYTIQSMTVEDLAEVMRLWSQTEGVRMSESDNEAGLAVYLARNPGVSQTARLRDGRLVGAVLCGHDGRRGYVYHLAVAPEGRGRGISRAMLAACFDRLKSAGILRCTLFVYNANVDGLAYWLHNGWSRRADLSAFQKLIPTEPAGPPDSVPRARGPEGFS